jgi:hypothetical protein
LSDKPREWPNVAKEVRDQAAEAAVEGIRMLTPVVEGKEMTETEKLRRMALALNRLMKIARLLESVGAPTRALD